MRNFLLIFLGFITFWFIDAPKGMIDYFLSLNSAFLKLFSFHPLLTTYGKPWKNEYREGLVGFSILMGMIIKGMVLLMDIVILLILVAVEIASIFLFICWPIATIVILFI